MYLRKPSVEILYCDESFLKLIEKTGRVCYKSEDRITNDSYKGFIKGLINKGHESIIEHSIMTVKFIIDRGIANEIVRHRLCAFSKESSRYVNYSKKGMEFIVPFWYGNIWFNIDKINEGLRIGWSTEEIKISCGLTEKEKKFLDFLKTAENTYNKMIGVYRLKPEQARAVLPTCTKTELVVSANFREWRLLKLNNIKICHLIFNNNFLLWEKICLDFLKTFVGTNEEKYIKNIHIFLLAKHVIKKF